MTRVYKAATKCIKNAAANRKHGVNDGYKCAIFKKGGSNDGKEEKRSLL